MEYLWIKMLHVGCVITSYLLFLIRGVWMLRDSPRLRRGWVKTAPHAVDTLLLGSAVAMAVISRQYPFVATWLTAKVFALLAYIGLGMIALRFGRSRSVRIAAWLAAQITFAYIVMVALTRNRLPWTAY